MVASSVVLLTLSIAATYFHCNAVEMQRNVVYQRWMLFGQQLCLLLATACLFWSQMAEGRVSWAVVGATGAAVGVMFICSFSKDSVKSLPTTRLNKPRWLGVYVMFSVLVCTHAIQFQGGATLTAAACSVLAIFLGTRQYVLCPKTEQRRPPTTEYTCELWEYLLFQHVNPLIAAANSATGLDVSDVPALSDIDSSQDIWARYLAARAATTRRNARPTAFRRHAARRQNSCSSATRETTPADPGRSGQPIARVRSPAGRLRHRAARAATKRRKARATAFWPK